jgi:hypothetical protein
MRVKASTSWRVHPRPCATPRYSQYAGQYRMHLWAQGDATRPGAPGWRVDKVRWPRQSLRLSGQVDVALALAVALGCRTRPARQDAPTSSRTLR